MKVGVLTIGQAPRTDIVPELKKIWETGVEIFERGALDGLSRDQIAQMAPEPDDYILVTRLADGSSVKVARRLLEPLLVKALREMDAVTADCLLLLCTGDFLRFTTQTLLVRPDEVLQSTVKALATERKVGVLTPSPSQVAQTQKKWGSLVNAVESVSPYGDTNEAFMNSATSLRDRGAEIIVMDCMGYTLGMKELVREASGLPTVLARSLVARVVGEILA